MASEGEDSLLAPDRLAHAMLASGFTTKVLFQSGNTSTVGDISCGKDYVSSPSQVMVVEAFSLWL